MSPWARSRRQRRRDGRRSRSRSSSQQSRNCWPQVGPSEMPPSPRTLPSRRSRCVNAFVGGSNDLRGLVGPHALHEDNLRPALIKIEHVRDHVASNLHMEVPAQIEFESLQPADLFGGREDAAHLSVANIHPRAGPTAPPRLLTF